jgi:hypothetical protein
MPLTEKANMLAEYSIFQLYAKGSKVILQFHRSLSSASHSLILTVHDYKPACTQPAQW